MRNGAGGEGVLNRLERFLAVAVSVIDVILEFVTSLILATIVLLAGTEIFLLSVLNKSLSWTYEINLLLVSWLYFLGIALVYNKKRDIIVMAIDRVLAEHMKWAYYVAVNALCVLFLLIVVRYGVILIQAQLTTRSAGVGVPNYFFTIPLVVGAISMILTLTHQSIETWLHRYRLDYDGARSGRQ